MQNPATTGNKPAKPTRPLLQQPVPIFLREGCHGAAFATPVLADQIPITTIFKCITVGQMDSFM
jgi:hypothetical protein